MRHLSALLFFVACSGNEGPDGPAGPTFELLGPDATMAGMDLDHLGADWARWVLEQPVATNPVIDLAGDACANGQTEGVFYLAGTFGGDPVTRTCAASSGPFLLPIYNVWYDNCGTLPEDVVTDDVLKSTIVEILDELDHVELTVDGEPVFTSLAEMAAYRTEVTAFSWVNPPTDGLYDSWGTPFTGTCDPSYAAGFYAPLAFEPGEHEISLVAGTVDFDVVVDYVLTVP
jgi:hypothetical protein